MKYKIKRRKKSIKSWHISVILFILLISISTSYALYTTQLTINGSAAGERRQLDIIYMYIPNSSSYPSTVNYMDTFTYTFSNPPSIDTVRMGGTVLIKDTDYTYANGTLTIPDVTGNILIEGERESVNVTFDIDGVTNVVNVPNGECVDKPANPIKAGNGFLGWADENDAYFDFTTPITTDITLYAKWIQGKVAEINGTYYNTLQSAISAVPTNNTETTVKLLTNVRENLTVASGKNINFDFQDYTITITSGCLLENNGTVKISNGNLISPSTSDGAVNNKQTGNLTISGGTIQMTNRDGKQALYNDKGTVLITGSAYISSASAQGAKNPRAAVQNLAQGTLTITGGTIESLGFQGVNNAGTMVIGTEDGNPDITTPVIQGATIGVNSDSNYSFYNGIIKGKNQAVNNTAKIINIENGYNINHSNEIINGQTYETAYLILATGLKTVTFNPNGGVLVDNIRYVETGEPVGTLPEPTRTNYIFDGWYTEGGEQITSNTTINNDITFYAHWAQLQVAEVNNRIYSSLKAAIDSVSANNTATTVTLLKNTAEAITIKTRQNIVLNLQNYTLSNSEGSVIIENKGTLTISNGNIQSNNNTIINNQDGATLNINGGRLIGTGSKQVVYNYGGGTVYISGDAYLSGSSTGTPSDNATTLERATVQNLSGGTISITGGTIIGTKQQAISNDGTLTLGNKNGSINTAKPDIRGETYGLKNLGTINFYDGIIKGRTAGISGTIDDLETNSQVATGSEVISGKTYVTEYLEEIQ